MSVAVVVQFEREVVDDKSKTPVEITDWEEDQLLSIYRSQLEYERGWEMDLRTKENKQRGE